MTQRTLAWFLDTLTAGNRPVSAPTHDGAAAFGGRVGAWLSRHARDWRRDRLRRQTIRELRARSDEQLKDIGVPRHMIAEVAERLARHEEQEERNAGPGASPTPSAGATTTSPSATDSKNNQYTSRVEST